LQAELSKPSAPSATSSFPLIPRFWLARAEKENDTFLGTRSLSLRGSALTCETKKNELCFYLGDANIETLAICGCVGTSSKNIGDVIKPELHGGKDIPFSPIYSAAVCHFQKAHLSGDIIDHRSNDVAALGLSTSPLDANSKKKREAKTAKARLPENLKSC